MKTLEEIGIKIGFTTKSKNYRKAFYDKYIRDEKLNYDIIIEHSDLIHIFDLKDKLDWDYISRYQKLSEDFIRDFIREFKDQLDWNYISKYQKLSESFMREFKDQLYWNIISHYQKLSESFMREFKDELYWVIISKYQKLSESFMREFHNKLDWSYISKYQKLSESFMREFSYKLDWSNISRYQNLSESFIKEFGHKLDWYYISKYQILSVEFTERFLYKDGCVKPENNIQTLHGIKEIKDVNVGDFVKSNDGFVEVLEAHNNKKNITATNLYKVVNECPGYVLDEIYVNNMIGIDFDKYKYNFSQQYLLNNGDKIYINDKLYRIKDDKIKLINFTQDHINQDTELFINESDAEIRLNEIEKNLNIKLEQQLQNRASSLMTLESWVNQFDDIDNLSYSDIKKIINGIKISIENIKK